MRLRFVPLWVIIGALTTLALLALNWLLQRIVALVLVALVLMLAGCSFDRIPTPNPQHCHKAIRYAIYQAGACVIYDI